ncbi:MAG: hypothetical protein WA071_11325 [Undibacterium umbellatum]
MTYTRRLMEQAAGTALPGWDIVQMVTQVRQFRKGEEVFAAGE